MNNHKTWTMQDMEEVFPASPAAKAPELTLVEIAEAVPKPAYHNSKFKAALLLGGSACLAVIASLIFSLTGSKTSEKVVATASEPTAPVTPSNDGWETAAKQSVSDAGQGINIPDPKKSTSAESPSPTASPSTTPSTAAKTDGSPTPTASTAPAVTQVSSKASSVPVNKPVVTPAAPQVVQAPKPVSQPVGAVKPKAISTVPSPSTTAAPASKPVAKPAVIANVHKPVAKPVIIAQASPKPAAPAVTKPIEVAKAPKPVASSIPMIAQASPKPVASTPVITKAVPQEPVRVTPRETLASNSQPANDASWEQASNLGVYGGDPALSVVSPPVGGLGTPAAKNAGNKYAQQRSNYEGAMSPTLLMVAGTNVRGRTIAPFSVGVSDKQSAGVPLTIALDEPIELSKGYRLPVGTTINFVASVRDNGSVVAISKNADINGVEIALPEGAISLAAENNGLLMAKEISTGDGDLARADASSSLWGGAAAAGRALVQSNSQTTSQTGLLGTTTQTTNGSPNIVGAVLDGAFSPLAANGQRRAQQKAEQIQKRTTLNTIDVNTKVKLFVNVPVQIQIPVGDKQVAQEVEQEEAPPPRLIGSNAVQIPATEQLPPPSSTTPAPPLQPTTSPSSLKPQKPSMSESE